MLSVSFLSLSLFLFLLLCAFLTNLGVSSATAKDKDHEPVLDITADIFEDTLARQPLLIEFYAPW